MPSPAILCHSQIANTPGQTKGIKTHCFFDEKPQLYLVDTPGLAPTVDFYDKDIEMYWKLKAMKICHKAENSNERDLCQYLLWKANQAKNYSYVDIIPGLNGPTNNIDVCICLSRLGALRVLHKDPRLTQLGQA